MDGARLVFVYNADSGVLNAVRDTWHRVTSPSTYPCNLCRLTYGATGMDRRWRDFTRSLGMPVVFLHRDEFRDEIGSEYAGFPSLETALPTVLVQRDRGLTEVVSARDLNTARSVDDLIRLVTDGLRGAGSGAEPSG